jgi:hydrocephalus-inducing protein
VEKINIVNTSPLDAEVTFCFLNDSKGDTYLLDPPSMSLKPSEQQVDFYFTCCGFLEANHDVF